MALPLLAVLSALAAPALGVERFPPPDFGERYTIPELHVPPAKPGFVDYFDTALLVGGIALAAWLGLRRRSRMGLAILAIVAVAYFGFVRHGCVCPIGAIQNVAEGLANPGYIVPIAVVAFFAIPIAATLAWGRVFCASVCPLGALQELVLLKPLRVPAVLLHVLGLAAFAYLGFAVLLAATGSDYIICRYDPFVAFFRFGGAWQMLAFGACVLLLAVFVGRPYCRFLCPLGAIFRPVSRLAKRHVTITPDECIQCRLCEDACPYGAINRPNEIGPSAPSAGRKAVLAGAILATGVLMVAGGWGMSLLGGQLARANYKVRLAEDIGIEQLAAELSARAAGPLAATGEVVYTAVTAADATTTAPAAAGTETPPPTARPKLVAVAAPAGDANRPPLWQRTLDATGRARPESLRVAVEGDRVWYLYRLDAPRGSAAESIQAVAAFEAATGRPLYSRTVPVGDNTSRAWAFRHSPSFQSGRRGEQALYAELQQAADAVRGQFYWGTWALGAFLGLVVGAKLIDLTVQRRRSDYEPDKAWCFSCGRCFRACPIDRQRRQEAGDE